MRAGRNCHNEHPEAGEGLNFEFDPTLRECPWSAIDQRAWAFLKAYRTWTDIGVLPYGCKRMGDLPQFMAEAFEIAHRADEAMDRLEASRRDQMMLAIIRGLGGRRG